MMECVDGEYQTFKAPGRRLRPRALLQHAGTQGTGRRLDRRRGLAPEPRRPRHLQDLRRLQGRHCRAQGRSDLILAKTIKGFGMGQAGEAMNISHQQKKMDHDAVRRFRDRFACRCPTTTGRLPYLKFAEDSPRNRQYMRSAAWTSAVSCPARDARPSRWPCPVPRRLRRPAEGFRRRPRIVDDDGHRPHHEHAAEGQERSARTSCPSSRTSPAPSAWKACSAPSASGTRKARTTCRKTMTS